MPTRQEQAEIASYLDMQTAIMRTVMTEIEQSIDLLRERRSALITAAVTGTILVGEVNS
jgi:type I restriction enzyme S subunit